ncbi:conserved hypothetical protein [Vibrio chagasii]|nr:conserved hypothetical protein [Vibrio chagasii]CAH7429084.1 conserved hypothetical protein [Vibrio chagasii]CAH7484709.1 conserved hypothetical protein [Vibrio chagasii]
MEKNIYYYWECLPNRKIPAYIELCLESWKKYLPDYKIHHVHKGNVFEYLDEDEFNFEYLFAQRMSHHSDIIGVALLMKYGGIFMDADVIATPYSARFLQECANNGSEMSMFGYTDTMTTHFAFIYAQKGASILEAHYPKMKERVNEAGMNQQRFDFFGNELLDKAIKCASKEQITVYDSYETGAILEPRTSQSSSRIERMCAVFSERWKNRYLSENKNNKEWYQTFYLAGATEEDLEFEINKKSPFILLHNSWNPVRHKLQSREQFLSENTFFTKLMIKLLEIEDSEIVRCLRVSYRISHRRMVALEKEIKLLEDKVTPQKITKTMAIKHLVPVSVKRLIKRIKNRSSSIIGK